MMNGREIECLINEKPAMMKKIWCNLRTKWVLLKMVGGGAWTPWAREPCGLWLKLWVGRGFRREEQSPHSSHTLCDPRQVTPSLWASEFPNLKNGPDSTWPAYLIGFLGDQRWWGRWESWHWSKNLQVNKRIASNTIQWLYWNQRDVLPLETAWGGKSIAFAYRSSLDLNLLAGWPWPWISHLPSLSLSFPRSGIGIMMLIPLYHRSKN